MTAGPHLDRSGPGTPTDWHVRAPAQVLDDLGAGEAGLSTRAAAVRRERFGTNVLHLSEPTPWWRTLGAQFLSPLIGILLAALVVVTLMQEWIDAAAVLLVLAFNAGIGFWQERRAESAVRALQELAAPACRVRRDGAERTLPAEELVPGDVVLLSSGERVPADLRLLHVSDLRVDESTLTGEVLAVTKVSAALPADTPVTDRTNLAFSGTMVTSGRAIGVVVATGADTELGEINELIQSTDTVTPLTLLTHRLERRIGVAVGVATALVFLAGLVLGSGASEIFRTAVALAVAAVPESLPIVLTVAMSVGVARMAQRHAIVRSLPAVETLGSTTVIASDKTGTLTRNELTVAMLWTPEHRTDLRGSGSTPSPRTGPGPLDAGGPLRELLRTGALTNEAAASTAPSGSDAPALSGDAVDVALARIALDSGAVTAAERDAPALADMPYEPSTRYSQTVRTAPDGSRVLHVKGAPDLLASLSTTMTEASRPIDRDLVDRANHALAAEGMRVIGMARRVLAPDEAIANPLPPPRDLTFLGLQGMEDPPRDGVIEAVAECRRAGIRLVMITGDQPTTATTIARRLGLPRDGAPVTGREMAALDDDALAERMRSTSVAARVSPQDKLRIVDLLRERGEIIAVTGDGVNDAPALRAASIGVAMGESGTDVAREAADIVLTDDNFVTIVDAVRLGRVTFAAIRNATFFLVATGLASLLAVGTNVLLQAPQLFLPVQLLFVNVVTNGLQDIAMSFEPGEKHVLRRPPRPRREGILSAVLWRRVALAAIWISLAIGLVFRWGLDQGYDIEHARTLAITLFVMMNFYLVGTARSENRSVFALSPLGNWQLLVAALGALLLHLGAMSWGVSAEILGFTTLTAQEWLFCAVAGTSVIVVVEGHKLLRAVLMRPSA